MTKAQINKQCKEILSEWSLSEIEDDANLMQDLEMASTDLEEVYDELELKFQIKFSITDRASLTEDPELTNIVDLIGLHLNA